MVRIHRMINHFSSIRFAFLNSLLFRFSRQPDFRKFFSQSAAIDKKSLNVNWFCSVKRKKINADIKFEMTLLINRIMAK